jgi:hypothetical protein
MIVLELEGGRFERFRVVFHPRVTVITGLSPSQRSLLGSQLTGAFGGADADFSLIVDVGAGPQELTSDLVADLGLARSTASSRSRTNELPGAVIVSEDGISEEMPTPFEPLPDASPLEGAREELRSAEAELQQLEWMLENARAGSPDAIAERVRQAEEDHQTALQAIAHFDASVDELWQRWVEDEDDPTTEKPFDYNEDPRRARLTELHGILVRGAGELQSEIDHEPFDMDDFAGALGAAITARDNPVTPEQAKQREQLAIHWHETMEALKARPVVAAPSAWVMNQARTELDAAADRVALLTSQVDRGIDVKAQLIRAQHALEDAQRVWDDLDTSTDTQTPRLLETLERLRSQIAAALGEVPADDDMERALLAHTLQQWNGQDPFDALIARMSVVGLDAGREDIIDLAEQWLERRNALAGSLAQLHVDVDHCEHLQAGLDAAEEIERDAAAQLADARSQTATPTLTPAQLEQLHRDHAEAIDGARAARRKVEYFAQLNAAKAPPVGAHARSGAPSDPSELEDGYVLARAAGLRRHGEGEAVPLVIDGSFDHLGSEFAARVLDVLPNISPQVQVVYLAGNDVAVEWAKRQQDDVAGVATPQPL